jgi:hypothetical protein
MRSDPLTSEEVEVAAYLVIALCDGSKDKAMAAIREAEDKYNAKERLHPIHMHIQHSVGLRKRAERMNAGPQT